MQFDWLLPAAVLLPLAAVPVAALVAGIRRSGDWLGLAVLGAEVLLCLLLVRTVAGNQGFALTLAAAHLAGASLELRLSVDLLSALFLLLTALVGLAAAVALVAQDDCSTDSGHQTPLTLLATGVLAGVFTAGNLITLYAFWQLATLAMCLPLALGPRPRSAWATERFVVLSEVGAVLVFFAAALTATQGAGQTVASWSHAADQQFRLAMLLLLTAAAATAVASPPFHSWLGPAADALRPTFVPFWLGAQSKIGLYVLARLCIETVNSGDAREWTGLLAALGAVVILVGSINALGERQAPRLMAFVLLAQTGYVVLGLGSGERLGLAGALFQVCAQTLAAVAVLLALAAVRNSVGSDDPSMVGGVAKRLPLAGFTFLVGTVSLVGMPLGGGFVGLLLIYHGLAASGEPWRLALVAIGLAGSLATGVALARLGGQIFLGERFPEQSFAKAPSAPTRLVLATAVLVCLAIGFLPRLVLDPVVAPLAGLKMAGSWVDLAVSEIPRAVPVGLWSPVWAGLLLAVPFAAVALAVRLERANPYPVLPADRSDVLALARALSPDELPELVSSAEPLRSERWLQAWHRWTRAGNLDLYRLACLPVAGLARGAAAAMRVIFHLFLR